MTNKAHLLRLREFPTQAGGIRFEYSCPSGCITGYIWGKDEGAIRDSVHDLRASHMQNATLTDLRRQVTNDPTP